MPARYESGKTARRVAVARKKRQPVRQGRTQSSSLGSSAARAHGYKAPARTVRQVARKQAQKPSQRRDLKVQWARDVVEEKRPGSAAQRGGVFREQAERNFRRQRIKKAERRLGAKFDERTGNFVRVKKRAILPDRKFVVDPRTGRPTTDIDKAAKQSKVEWATAGSTATALQILDETLRPTRAVMGAAREAARGRPDKIPVAVKKGLIDNEGPLGGEVLREMGVPKGLAAPLGFAADVLADPTTYVTGGAKSIAAREAARTARQVQKRAVKEGMSKSGAELVASRAAQRAAENARTGKGVTVAFAGRELPGVTRVTERVGGGIARATPEGVKRRGRTVLRQVNPAVAPEGVNKQQFLRTRQAEGRARAAQSNVMQEAVEQANLLLRRVPEKDREAFISAIEMKRIGKLPEKQRVLARQVRDQMRYARRLRARAGVPEGTIGRQRATRVTAPKGLTAQRRLTSGVSRPPLRQGEAREYFPRMLDEVVEPGSVSEAARRTATGGKARTLTPPSSKRREDRRPIAVANAARLAEGKGAFSTNAPLVRASYGAQTAGAVAKGELVESLKNIGRPVNKRSGRPGAGEAVYRFPAKGRREGVLPKKLDLNDADDIREFNRAIRAGEIVRKKDGTVKVVRGKQGQYRILDERVADDAMGRIEQGRTEIGAAFDRAQGTWKLIATATPGFQVRNLIGDNQMAFLAQGRKLPANAIQGARATRRISQLERARQEGRHLPRSTKSIKVGGQRMNLDDFVREAMREGIGRGGQRGAEIQSFRQGAGQPEVARGLGRTGRVRGQLRKNVKQPVTGSKAWRAAGRALRNREDMTRLATYKWARDQKMSPEDAAMAAKSVHFDYGEVTEAERVFFRRAAPFYTFSARALPFHVKALLKHPGRYAGIEKARQELSGAFGMEDKDLPEYKQRAIPFAAPGGRALDAALPLNLLNEVPDPTNLGKLPGEWGQFVAGQHQSC